MNAQILTLFGEEKQPEQINAVGKSRAVKKNTSDNTADENGGVLRGKPEKTKNNIAHTDILKDWKATKQYYSIGEVALLFEVKTSHIRFWTNEFAIKIRTTRKGDRLYTPDHICELRNIYHLVKERGFTINGAKTKLKTNKKTSEPIDLKQSLLQLRNKLLIIRNQL